MNCMYSTVQGFWPVQELVLLANGHTRCGEVASVGCFFAWNVIVARPPVITEVYRIREQTHY
jgi:hypothetical protein